MKTLISNITDLYCKIQNVDTSILEDITKEIRTSSYMKNSNEKDESKILINEFIKNLVELLIKNNNDSNRCIELLTKHKIDKLFISCYLGYAAESAREILCGKLLNSLDNGSYAMICKFILDRFVLTDDFKNKKPEELFEYFENVEVLYESQIVETCAFISSKMLEISNRDILPDSLANVLENDAQINNDKVVIFTNLMDGNLEKMYNAALFRLVSKIACRENDSDMHCEND